MQRLRPDHRGPDTNVSTRRMGFNSVTGKLSTVHREKGVEPGKGAGPQALSEEALDGHAHICEMTLQGPIGRPRIRPVQMSVDPLSMRAEIATKSGTASKGTIMQTPTSDDKDSADSVVVRSLKYQH